MKPEAELLRRIMLDTGNSENPYLLKLTYPDMDHAKVNWHIAHLIRCEFLDGSVIDSGGIVYDVAITGISPKGYEFITAIENDSVWQKFKAWSAKTAIPATAAVLWEHLKTYLSTVYSLLALKTPISRATKSVRNLERSRLAAFYKVGGL
jgi:hypothetical protein